MSDAPSPRKDRLIQTRVNRDLETTLKEEARRRRLTVSQLIRNVLEDAFNLVDDVVANVDDLVNDSVELARQVSRETRRFRDELGRAGGEAQRARKSAPEPDQARAPEPDPDLAEVDAWNPVVLNREASCASCGAALKRGQQAYAGMGGPEARRLWLCSDCLGRL